MKKPQVVKLAQPGYDVKTAGDENLIYNSNWPLLKIYKQGSFTTNDNTTTNQLVVSHDLGYVPAFWFFSNNDIADWAGGSSSGNFREGPRSEFNGPAEFFPGANESKMVFDIAPGFLNGTKRFYYYIFALDITKPYQAPAIKTGSQTAGGSSNIVFKLAKAGKDIISKHLEDFIVHSDARSPLIHAVYPGITKPSSNYASGNGFTFYHNLGYVPMFFAYAKTGNGFGVSNPTTNSYILLIPDGSGSSGFTVDEQKISYQNLNPNFEISIVVLKDPFNIDQSVSVTV